MTIGSSAAALFLSVAACGSTATVTPDAGAPDAGAPDAGTPDAGAPDAALPAPVGPFPTGFQWGTAIAPYQVEGGLHGDDWFRWETLCGSNCSGQHADDGPDFWDHYDEDFARAEALGTNAIRLGIDWSRVFPTAGGAPDADAVAHYHAILASARQHHLLPMVTLHHFATPTWLMDLDDLAHKPGWEDPAIVPAFVDWATYCAGEFGGEVDWWVTINEPFAYISGGYLSGTFPPGRVLDVAAASKVAQNMLDAAAQAYDAIHAHDTVDADGDGKAALVSFATHNRVFLPLDPASAADMAAADTIRKLNNLLFLEALVRGNVDLNFDGDTDDPDETDNAAYKGKLDWIGLNYYGVSLVQALPGGTFPLVGLPFISDLDNLGLAGPLTDFGWTDYPQGFRPVLDEVAAYGLPIIVTENGIADADDDQRPRFLIEHLYALARAIDDGLDIRGYYHWSLMDNFEWAAGYCPRFGLYRVDFTDPARPRHMGAGAAVYRTIIQSNTVSPQLFAAYPTFPPPGLVCRSGF
jgi:beta-glucosidase/6-phospho-beta-glucosidase/beta-galactosidase